MPSQDVKRPAIKNQMHCINFFRKGAAPFAIKKLKKTVKKSEAKKREANDSNSSTSVPSSTSPTKRARVTKTQIKAASKEEPISSSIRTEDRDSGICQ